MAKLHRVDPMTDPGITRKGAGTGFTYAGPRGGKVSEADLARIKALALPPAWTDVWICTDPLGHIQAVGTDEGSAVESAGDDEQRSERAPRERGRRDGGREGGRTRTRTRRRKDEGDAEEIPAATTDEPAVEQE